ncbi:hypothetical protein BFW01_g5449 [Lasiodiplodia theobromae]|uniref:Uncharacterized protein n=1 Tax=Lasiodiplodia theobromae TaxID=45133 RepID=A0A5N5DR90_9PEZI|nr:uncharacterized protein LTHEOB_903 [Lasiodiplodia theobromae]KAB2579891.1 hypothetical protein DBV05_g1516 [Lasiodiplodia theobromae]KAF4540961.1 hypothetical protein LTHEOB_903 [Lasiodiplodia theobromae]KAF9634554.1 hypothetical protein BFW01_g5449 [Lasiodiplodia theobromae]
MRPPTQEDERAEDSPDQAPQDQCLAVTQCAKDLSNLRRGQRRRIRRELESIDPSTAHPQKQSPLWSKLPPELRNQIFTLAVSQHVDLTRPYPENSWYYRPGYTHAFAMHTDLLATCRLAYWETSAIPLSTATLPVWEDRGPPDAPKWRFAEFTARNTALLNHVHFFVRRPNGHWYTPLSQFRPKHITVTIRHTSWYGWPNDKPLMILDTWRHGLIPANVKFPSCLQDLTIEFETLKRKKDQLNNIIKKKVSNWRFPLEDGTVLSPLTTPPKYSEWTGAADFGGVKWRLAHGNLDTIDYVVVTMTWTPHQSTRETIESA